MLLLILIVTFSSLTFKGLTLAGLFHWLNFHPFWATLLVLEILTSSIGIRRK